MLVISQKKGQKIHLGRDITITIVDAKPGKVKIGIEAPASIHIERDNNSDINAVDKEKITKSQVKNKIELDNK